MKRKLMIAMAFASIALSGGAYAQIHPADFLKAGGNDAASIMGAYMSPYFKAFGAGLNSGWYTTGATHTRFFPDLSLNFSLIQIPSVDQNFDVSSLGLKVFTVSGSNIAPTAAGDKSSTFYDINAKNPKTGQTENLAHFQSPNGSNIPLFFTPTAQIGIGIGWGTDIMVRYMPDINLGDKVGKIGLFGFGVKHDIKQWIPGMSMLPFDWSVLFGYSQFNYSLPIEYQPYDSSPITDLQLSAKVKAYNFGTIISKNIAVVTGYIGLGYQMSSTNVTIDGSVPVPSIDSQGNKTTTNVTIPQINITGANSPYANLGIRLKLLVFTINADYTFSSYPVTRLGLGLSL